MRIHTMVLMLTTALLYACSPYSNMSEKDMLSYIRDLADPADRLDGFDKFLVQFPASPDGQKVRYDRFTASVAAGSQSRVIQDARSYLDSVSESRKVVETVDAIVKMSRKGMALDTSLVWLQSVEARAATMHVYYQAACLDAKALIYHHKNQPSEAYKFQKAAVDLYDGEMEFIRNLAVYEEANGRPLDAIRRVVPLAMQGDQESVTHFLQWSSSLYKDESASRTFRDSLAEHAATLFIDTTASSRRMTAQSSAALFLARAGVQPAKAEAWSNETIRSLNARSALEDFVEFTKNHFLVLAALGRKEEAVAVFESVADLVDPWQTSAWMMYGTILEGANQPARASRAYATGLLVSQDEDLQAAFERAYVRSNGTRKGLSKYGADLKDSLSRFSPPHRTTPKNPGKVVLAELFTGADCGPCVSADLAFDALSEYFDRDEVAILEYHLHIPRPDPLTTNDGWGRYKNYGGDFGTPTVFIDGTDRVGGGGPKFLTGNRFAMYQKTAEKMLHSPSDITLSVTPSWMGNSVRVDVKLGDPSGRTKKMPAVLHIALIEKSVTYTGSNGINPHAFVVRKLADGPNGFPIRPSMSTASRLIDMDRLEAELQVMIDRPETLPSKSASMTKKPAWKNLPEKMNRANLAVVAWIQNTATQEVQQAVYAELPAPK